MSLEESMLELAKSNTELAAAQTRLAEAQEKVADKYDEMIAFVQANGGEKLSASGKNADDDEKSGAGKTGKATKAATKKTAAKTTSAASEDDNNDDGMGGESAAEEALDFDTVKAKLLEVRDVFGDKSHALAIIKKHGGYAALTEIQEKDFRKIYDAAVAKLATKSDDEL